MLAMGFALTIGMITKPRKNCISDVLAILVNFVIVSIVITDLARVISLPKDVKVGMVILALPRGRLSSPNSSNSLRGASLWQWAP
jgi:predicted Na+-dependent transporter